MKKLASALAAGAMTLGFALIASFTALNWLTNCQSWDRELWTAESSCVTPGDVWHALKGGRDEDLHQR